MRNIFSKLIMLFVLCMSGFVLFSGCAGKPEVRGPRGTVDALPEEQSVYGKIQIKENEDILSGLFSSMQISADLLELALDRTDSLSFSLGRQNESFTVIVSGDFPKSILQGEIRKLNMWKKQKNLGGYWLNEKEEIGLAFLDADTIAVSTGSIEEVITRYQEFSQRALPKELELEFEISDAVFYMPQPGTSLSSALGSSRDLPIELMWITLFSLREEGMYDVSAVFRMSGEDDAVSFSKIAKLLILFLFNQEEIGNAGQLRSSLKVTQKGTVVRIQGIPLSEGDISDFLESRL